MYTFLGEVPKDSSYDFTLLVRLIKIKQIANFERVSSHIMDVKIIIYYTQARMNENENVYLLVGRKKSSWPIFSIII